MVQDRVDATQIGALAVAGPAGEHPAGASRRRERDRLPAREGKRAVRGAAPVTGAHGALPANVERELHPRPAGRRVSRDDPRGDAVLGGRRGHTRAAAPGEERDADRDHTDGADRDEHQLSGALRGHEGSGSRSKGRRLRAGAPFGERLHGVRRRRAAPRGEEDGSADEQRRAGDDEADRHPRDAVVRRARGRRGVRVRCRGLGLVVVGPVHACRGVVGRRRAPGPSTRSRRTRARRSTG